MRRQTSGREREGESMATDRTEDARPARILYTAEAVVHGGLNGVARTSDGRLAVSLSVPRELGGDEGTGRDKQRMAGIN
jgi:hypothetical protein